MHASRSFEDECKILRLAGRKLHGLSVLCLRYNLTRSTGPASHPELIVV
jgi:hypothetical protein